jgi:hypothetical protein
MAATSTRGRRISHTIASSARVIAGRSSQPPGRSFVASTPTTVDQSSDVLPMATPATIATSRTGAVSA